MLCWNSSFERKAQTNLDSYDITKWNNYALIDCFINSFNYSKYMHRIKHNFNINIWLTSPIPPSSACKLCGMKGVIKFPSNAIILLQFLCATFSTFTLHGEIEGRFIIKRIHHWQAIIMLLRGYCTPGPYFWRLCAFSQKIKQLRTKYPMDMVRNVLRNSKITVLLQ